MNMLFERLPVLAQRALLLLQELLWLVLALAIGWFATRIMIVAQNQTSSSLGVTMDKVYLAQVVGGAYLALIAVRRLVTRLTPYRLIEIR
jgi:TRAP-type C4-dicarboxylate transport system permease small subunit